MYSIRLPPFRQSFEQRNNGEKNEGYNSLFLDYEKTSIKFCVYQRENKTLIFQTIDC